MNPRDVDPVGFAAGRPAFAVFRASTLAALRLAYAWQLKLSGPWARRTAAAAAGGGRGAGAAPGRRLRNAGRNKESRGSPGCPQKWKSGSPGWPIGHLQMRSFKSSRLVLSATSGLGLAGTSRRGGAGGIGGCWSPGPWRMKPPGPIERYCISGADRGGLRVRRRWSGSGGSGGRLCRLRPLARQASVQRRTARPF